MKKFLQTDGCGLIVYCLGVLIALFGFLYILISAIFNMINNAQLDITNAWNLSGNIMLLAICVPIGINVVSIIIVIKNILINL